MAQVYGTSNFIILSRQLNVSLTVSQFVRRYLVVWCDAIRAGTPTTPLHGLYAILSSSTNPFSRIQPLMRLSQAAFRLFAQVQRNDFVFAGLTYKVTTRPSSDLPFCPGRIVERANSSLKDMFYWLLGKSQNQVLSLK